MIKRVHFIRHGETIFNALKKIQGSSDIELNEKGIEQAKSVKINKEYDLYLHSGLIRSKETLDIIINNKSIEKKEEKLIIERSYGIFEGLKEDEIRNKYPDIFINWKKDEDTLIESAEKISDVVIRFKKFIKKILEGDSKDILAVTHSGFLYSIYKYMKNIEYGIRPDIYFKNCSNVFLEIYDNDFEIILKLSCDNGEIIEKYVDILSLD